MSTLLQIWVALGCVLILGCRKQRDDQPKDARASRSLVSHQPEKVTPVRTWTETDLDDEQNGLGQPKRTIFQKDGQAHRNGRAQPHPATASRSVKIFFELQESPAV